MRFLSRVSVKRRAGKGGLVKVRVSTGKKQHGLYLVGQKANVGQTDRQEHRNPPCPAFTSALACFP